MLHLDLQPELEARFAAEATTRGQSTELYVEQLLANHAAIEGYREGRLTESQVGTILGLANRMEVHAFLARNNIDLQYTEDHLLQDIAASNRHHSQRTLVEAHGQ